MHSALRFGLLCLISLFCSIGPTPGWAQTFSAKCIDSSHKLYCVVVASQKHRIQDFCFAVCTCPVGAETCTGERKPFSLINSSRNVQGAVIDEVLQRSSQFEIAFDGGEADGQADLPTPIRSPRIRIVCK